MTNDATQLIQRCHEFALVDSETDASDPDSLIGFFQLFRPDGKRLSGLFDVLPCGADLHERLDELFQVAGEDRRPEGGRDAYFLVRNPPPMDDERASLLARDWLGRLASIAEELGDSEFVTLVKPAPTIRVLEGRAPKHPKAAEEKCSLLLAMQTSVVTWCQRLDEQLTGQNASSSASVIRQAYYYTACDPMLRDYLMWPLFAQAAKTIDPFAPYFQLWKHGVKYRIFGNQRIDLYLPRREGLG